MHEATTLGRPNVTSWTRSEHRKDRTSRHRRRSDAGKTERHVMGEGTTPRTPNVAFWTKKATPARSNARDGRRSDTEKTERRVKNDERDVMDQNVARGTTNCQVWNKTSREERRLRRHGTKRHVGYNDCDVIEQDVASGTTFATSGGNMCRPEGESDAGGPDVAFRTQSVVAQVAQRHVPASTTRPPPGAGTAPTRSAVFAGFRTCSSMGSEMASTHASAPPTTVPVLIHA
jgi:hypothetical protein